MFSPHRRIIWEVSRFLLCKYEELHSLNIKASFIFLAHKGKCDLAWRVKVVSADGKKIKLKKTTNRFCLSFWMMLSAGTQCSKCLKCCWSDCKYRTSFFFFKRTGRLLGEWPPDTWRCSMEVKQNSRCRQGAHLFYVHSPSYGRFFAVVAFLILHVLWLKNSCLAKRESSTGQRNYTYFNLYTRDKALWIEWETHAACGPANRSAFFWVVAQGLGLSPSSHPFLSKISRPLFRK